ncbi:hypothetical protein BH09BAC3_BH09BAC3_37770 [soil metagenome]
MKSRITLVFLFVLTGMAAYAQDATPKTDVRQASERARIHQGRKSGELTNKEAAGLNAQQRSIRRTERRTKSDGTVTTAEQRRLNKKQNRASRSIRRQKNDAQVKPQ